MVDLISLLKLLKELLPEEVYKKIFQYILKLMENEDRFAYEEFRRMLLDWVRQNYPELEKLMKLILDRLRPAGVEESAAYISLGGIAEAGGVLLSGPLAILAGLLLPATSWWGMPRIDLGGWWRDPCDERYAEICDAYAGHLQERGSFPTGFVPQSPAVGNLLSGAGHLITLCKKFLKECPNHKRRKVVEFIDDKVSGYQTEYWNF